jgi:hypothetical protein
LQCDFAVRCVATHSIWQCDFAVRCVATHSILQCDFGSQYDDPFSNSYRAFVCFVTLCKIFLKCTRLFEGGENFNRYRPGINVTITIYGHLGQFLPKQFL